MNDSVKVRIKLMVGSNGKVSASTEDMLDWGDLADNIMDYPKNGSPSDPETSARYFIDVEVPVPTIGSLTPVVTLDKKV